MDRSLAIATAALALFAIVSGRTASDTIYVDVGWSGGTYDGGETSPYQTFGDAISAVHDSSISSADIYMADGNYTDTANGGLEDFSTSASYTLFENDGGGTRIQQTLNIYGGYTGWTSGSSFDWTGGNRTLKSTVIDAENGNARILTVNRRNSQTNLSGLTLQNGESTGNGGAVDVNSGWLGGFSVTDCRFEGNEAQGEGGAIDLVVGDRKTDSFTRVEFVDNVANGHGGAASVSAGSQTYGFTVTDSSFSGNQANGSGNDGGAIYMDDFSPTFDVNGSSFEDNSANGTGGAVAFHRASNATFAQVVFAGNSSGNDGAAIGNTGDDWVASTVTLRNCLVVENTGGVALHHASKPGAPLVLEHVTLADNPDGGVYVERNNGTANLEVTNSIIANNGAFGLKTDDNGTSEYNDVWNHTDDYVGLSAGTGDISADPRFLDAANDDYSISGDSPASGTATDLGIYVDLIGVERPIGGFDMGAYEIIPDTTVQL